MKKIKIMLLLLISTTTLAKDMVVIGKVPDRYLGKDGKKASLSKVTIKNEIIQEIVEISPEDSSAFILDNKDKVLELKDGDEYLVMYPGLVDLHNHTKQNILSAWGDARGQFGNRFEWRAYGNYKKAVSGNMNSWIGFGGEVNCAAFRWSEMQAMVIGTTYLQGPSSCVKNFSISQVEDKDSFNSTKDRVQAPTDIILPSEMAFVWHALKPIIEEEAVAYPEALKRFLHRSCPKTIDVIDDVLADDDLKILKDKTKMMELCDIVTKEDESKFPPKFLRYVYWIHKTIAGRLKYLNSENKSAVIGHLAEGRRNDPYNKLEFELIKLLGLDREGVNFVHAVALNKEDFKHMKDKNMGGVIWSPYSNLLLYGETARIADAKSEGVILALGSDWTPTGSRGVFEELKLAKQYILKDPLGEGLPKLFSDEDLFDMVTKNPAIMINHFESDPDDGEAGIGTLRVGAMGTFIALKESNKENVYSNLIDSMVGDISLVVVDGEITYGDEKIVNTYDDSIQYEVVSNKIIEKKSVLAANPPKLDSEPKNSVDKHLRLVEFSSITKNLAFSESTGCEFSDKKVFVHQNTLKKEKRLNDFFKETGLNFDRFEDINKVLAIGLLSQSRNVNDPSRGDSDYVPEYFPPLFSCDDPEYEKRLYGFVKADSKDDEYSINLEKRKDNRNGLGSKVKSMAKAYGIEYVKEDY